MSRRLLPLLLALVLPAASACRTVPGAQVVDPPRPPVGRSVQGRPIPTFVVGEGPRTVLFVATVHGDEPAGAALLETLVGKLVADPTLLSGARAVVVPVLNPDGLAARTRRNANQVDLNRNFPATNFEDGPGHGADALSEPESRFLFALVQRYRPERILSFHQPADRLDYEGPAIGFSYRLAAVSPFEVRRMGTRKGSLGAWAGADLGIATVTVELPKDATDLDREAAWERYGPLLLEALRD